MVLNNFVTFLSAYINRKIAFVLSDVKLVHSNTCKDSASDMRGQFVSYGTILVGTGEGQANYSDSTLNDMISDLTVLSREVTFPSDAKIMMNVSVTLQNDTPSVVTITNIGIATPCANVSGDYILWTKEILEKPITLNPGDSHTFVSIIGAQ